MRGKLWILVLLTLALLAFLTLWASPERGGGVGMPTAADRVAGAEAGLLEVEPDQPAPRRVLMQTPAPSPPAPAPALPGWDGFRDPAWFIQSPDYNPARLELDAQQRTELDLILREVNSTLLDLRSRMHSVAARHMLEAFSLGLARADTGEADRIGDEELRVFTQSEGQQYYVDFDLGQFADLDVVIADRDAAILAGHESVVQFFSSLSSKEQ